jgi:trigger factor
MGALLGQLKRGLGGKTGAQLRDLLKEAPSAPPSPSLAGTRVPAVEAPAIDDVCVVVPAPEPVSVEDILARFAELRREHAIVRARRANEHVALGDEIRVDIVGWRNGDILPYSARQDAWIDVMPDEVVPGFALGIVGARVGDTAIVDVTLPLDYPVAELRAARAVFAVTVNEALDVTLPAEDDATFLAATGRGETIEAVMESIANELEAELVDTLVEQGHELVLDELARRVDVEVPAGLVNEEIRRRWQATEGELLLRAGVGFDDQQRAALAWRDDPSTRASVEHDLRRAIALGAVAKRDEIRVSKEDVEAYLRGMAKATGARMVELVETVQRERSIQRALDEKLLALLVRAHVIAHAEVRYEGAELPATA